MSIQTALQFIQQVRRDETLREEIAALGDAALGDEVTLDRLVEFATAAGFRFTAEELQKAHGYDWAMRWAHFHPNNNRKNEHP